MRKGVLLAGGLGTRLRPATLIYNKHLALVYDKPMVCYPLQILKDLGCEEILLVTGGEHIGGFAEFLGDIYQGMKVTYKVQTEAGGIAQALLLAEGFVDSQFPVILGDNFFEYLPVIGSYGCALIVKEAPDPERFGVYNGTKILEKPKRPSSNKAVTGLYFYTPEIFKYIKTLKPSERGELEITDVNNYCLEKLDAKVFEFGGFWSDMGTPESLLRTANFIHDNNKG